MADCFSLQSIKEIVEDLRAIEAYGEMLVSSYEAGNYADAIEQLLAENARLKERCELLQGNNVLLRGCVDKYNIEQIERLREENAKLKAERNAAVADLKDFSDSESCCFYCRKFSSAGCTECKWEWRGVKEDKNAGKTNSGDPH